jgi:hypothetical protein
MFTKHSELTNAYEKNYYLFTPETYCSAYDMRLILNLSTSNGFVFTIFFKVLNVYLSLCDKYYNVEISLHIEMISDFLRVHTLLELIIYIYNSISIILVIIIHNQVENL